jgi:hypothetical protein
MMHLRLGHRPAHCGLALHSVFSIFSLFSFMPRASCVSHFDLVYLVFHCLLVLVLTCLLVPTLLSFVSGYVLLLPPLPIDPLFPLPFIPISLPMFRTYLLACSLCSIYLENYLIPRSRRASEFRLHGSNVLKYSPQMYKRASELSLLTSVLETLSDSKFPSSFFNFFSLKNLVYSPSRLCLPRLDPSTWDFYTFFSLLLPLSPFLPFCPFVHPS